MTSILCLAFIYSKVQSRDPPSTSLEMSMGYGSGFTRDENYMFKGALIREHFFRVFSSIFESDEGDDVDDDDDEDPYLLEFCFNDDDDDDEVITKPCQTHNHTHSHSHSFNSHNNNSHKTHNLHFSLIHILYQSYHIVATTGLKAY
ncbi:hypothetical protein B0F90DRAFT_32141 [Multifurca ochricompacta]|uniref:Uncharacterized protein n=1 Tax=Multifurca ochricompacta TaxID=376703 RepID=A0AAD4MC20_9AGAM|nr:hypothetical protein B0F90DRAFT_32141 [Multifurca ochricompacta]